MFFRLLRNVGNHTQLNAKGVPTVYKAGDTIESNFDLAKCFSKKFERVNIDTESAKPNLAPGIPMSSAVAATALDSEAPEGPVETLGTNITSQYVLPKGKNIKIYSVGGGWCTIRTNDNPKTDEKLRMNAIQTWIDLTT